MSSTYFKIFNLNCKNAISAILFVFCLQNIGLSQNHVSIKNITAAGSTEIYEANTVVAYENNHYLPSSSSGTGTFNAIYGADFRYSNVINKIELKIDRDAFSSMFSTTQEIEINFTILGEKYDVSTSSIITNPFTTSGKLSVKYNPNILNKDKEVDVIIIPDNIYSKITITDIKINGSSVPTSVSVSDLPIILSNSINIDIDDNFNPTNFTSNNLSLSASFQNVNGCQDNISISWLPYPGAKSYELEWIFVDDWVDNKTQYSYDFKNNSTRIQLTNTNYSFPVIYEDGCIIYRIRGIGQQYNSNEQEWEEVASNWTMLDKPESNSCQGPLDLRTSSSGYCTDRYIKIVNPFATDKNWQYGISFVEDAKSKGVINYFDGTLRNRQTITVLNTENKALVAQTIYDFIGRPAIQPLPVPDLVNTNYCFRPNFNVRKPGLNQSSLSQYNWKDFDIDYIGNCGETRTGEMESVNTSSGAAWYYSANNSLLTNGATKTYEKFIPDAEGYPFVQTEYMNDNSGRIKRISGLGKQHRLNGVDQGGLPYSATHEVKYGYSKPQQEELYMLFGNEVGLASHYEKNVVYDANGQASVSYIDAYGRTIATALAGEPDTKFASSLNPKTITTKYDNTFINKTDKAIVTSEDVYFSVDGLHEIQYSVTPEILSQECMPAGVCFTCIYDLSISITNSCGEQMLPNGIVTRKVGTINQQLLNNGCTAVPFSLYSPPLSFNIPKGIYHVEKRLTVNKEAFEGYKKQYLEQNNCVKTLEEFVAEEEAQINSRECNYNCETCQSDLNFYNTKIVEFDQRITNYQTDPLSLEELNRRKAELVKVKNLTTETCNELCKSKSVCEQMYDLMLIDVSPNGQYAEYKNENGDLVEDIKYSLLNSTNNQLGNSNNNNWKNPSTDYKDDNGNIVLIEIINNLPEQRSGAAYFDALGNTYANSGPKFIKPYDLKNLNDFVALFQTSWAKSLVVFHPEYDCWQNCNLTKEFYDFDMKMYEVNTFSEALSKGYLNPIISSNLGNSPNSPYQTLIYPFNSNIDLRDPIVRSSYTDYYNGQTLRNSLDLKLHSIIEHNGVTYTAWQLLELYRAQIDDVDGHCGDDLLWAYFRAMYLNAKYETMKGYYEGSACHYFYQSLDPLFPKERRFYFSSSISDIVKQGLEVGNQSLLNGDPDGIKNNVILASNTGEVAKKCDKTCNLYADQWMKKLAGCSNVYSNFVPGDPLWELVKNKLIEVCKNGCDANHPLGSSSINPLNTSASFSSFKDVLLNLKSTSGVNYDLFQKGICDDILITWPMPYDHDYFAYESAEANKCACDNSRFNELQIQSIRENCPEYNPEGQPYMDCACDQTDEAKRNLLLSTKEIPVENKCNTCYTCIEVYRAAQHYNEEYNSSIPLTHADFPVMVTAYLNKYLKLNLTYIDYKEFIAKCYSLNTTSTQDNVIWESVFGNEIYFSDKTENLNLMPTKESVIGNSYVENINYDLWRNFIKPPLNISTEITNDESLMASVLNDFVPLQPTEQTQINTQLDDVKCNCKKILNAWKIAETSGKTLEQVMMDLYPGFTPVTDAELYKLKCLKMFNGIFPSNENPTDLTPVDINKYPLNGTWTPLADIVINQEISWFGLGNFADKPCVEDPIDAGNGDLAPLDDCACKKILDLKSQYDNLSPLNNPYGTFDEFVKQTQRISSTPGFDKLAKECLRFYQTTLGEDDDGNPMQYTTGSNFNLGAKKHLAKDVSTWGYKVATKILCTPVPPPPCPPNCPQTPNPTPIPCSLSCNDIRNWVSNYISTHSLPTNYPQFQYNTSVEKAFLMSKENDVAPEPMATQWLNDMQNQFNTEFQNNKAYTRCRPFNYTYSQIMSMLSGCMAACPSLNCEAIGLALKNFINARKQANFNNPNPSYIPESFETEEENYVSSMAGELQCYSNHVRGVEHLTGACDRPWAEMTGFMNDFIAHMNTSFSNGVFCAKSFTAEFLAKLYASCMPQKPIIGPKQSPCKVCYTLNSKYKLDDIQKYLNQVAKGDGGITNLGEDQMDMSNWKLKNAPRREIPTYYDQPSTLYAGGTNANKLRYFTAMDYPLPPHLPVTVVDNLGHMLNYELFFPGEESWYHWGEIIKFRNIRVEEPPACTVPTYFRMDVDIWMSPSEYKYFHSVTGITINGGIPFHNTNIDEFGYKHTIVMTGTITSDFLATKTQCPSQCYKLCNKPIWPSVEEADECINAQVSWAYNNAQIRYQQYYDKKVKDFENAYYAKCLSAKETFTDKHQMNEYHHTLYYYDRAGSLIKTVPPAGVDVPYLSNTQIANRVTQADNYAKQLPGATYQNTTHNLITHYQYNTLGQLIRQQTPDGGISRFWYDKLGRNVASQNANQFKRCAAVNNGIKFEEICSYSQYDALGRVIEAGEKRFNIMPSSLGWYCSGVELNTCLFGNSTSHLQTNFYNYGTNTQVYRTYYDYNSNVPWNRVISQFETIKGKNLKKRVVASAYFENGVDLTSASHYSYDAHGNVDILWQQTPALKNFTYQEYKRFDYTYDLIGGKVNKATFQKGYSDQLIHQYNYDEDNRLTEVNTSTDGHIWQRDAQYQYLLHGPLGKTILGQNKVQGIDNAYTIQGWIKNVNSDALTALNDMGKDGLFSSTIAKDAFGFSLQYFTGDYKPIELSMRIAANAATSYTAGSDVANNITNMYNGNISHMVTALPDKALYTNNYTIAPTPLATTYTYDQLNRLTQVKAFSNFNGNTNTWATNGYTGTNQYAETFTYDANGNILNAQRNGHNVGATMEMDNLNYKYNLDGNNRLISNKLYHVKESNPTNSANYTDDIDDQTGVFNNAPSTINTANNYGYDEIGNLVRDNAEQIANIEWTLDGKIKSITRNGGSLKDDLEFGYNAAGQRLYKTIKPRTGLGIKPQKDWKTTWYIRDATGNPIATYTQSFSDNSPTNPTKFKEHLTIDELTIYGSSRLGTIQKELLTCETEFNMMGYNTSTGKVTLAGADGSPIQVTGNYYAPYQFFDLYLGNKRYELTNHLGNVLAVISDRKIAHDDPVFATPNTIDYYHPEYMSFGMYYAFGAPLPNRDYKAPNTKGYKYGFNGQEKDDEVSGAGNSNTAEYWQYDTRLGKRFNVDPVVKEFESPYATFGGNPIFYNDINGDDWYKPLGEDSRWTWSNDVKDQASAEKIGGKGSLYAHVGYVYESTNKETISVNGVNKTYSKYVQLGQNEWQYLDNNDNHVRDMIDGKYVYTQNYGWVDRGHAFGATEGNNYFGANETMQSQLIDNLINIEQSEYFSSVDGYRLNWSMGAGVKSYRQFFWIKNGLNYDDKVAVACAILCHLSLGYENLQSYHPFITSSFSPEDLPSNILGLYSTKYMGYSQESIMNLIKPLSITQSLEVYRQYPGTFSDAKYKNKTFSPIFFPNRYSPSNPSVPSALTIIKPAQYMSNWNFWYHVKKK